MLRPTPARFSASLLEVRIKPPEIRVPLELGQELGFGHDLLLDPGVRQKGHGFGQVPVGDEQGIDLAPFVLRERLLEDVAVAEVLELYWPA
jgi:hypothetical protein